MFTKIDERLWSDDKYLKLSDDGKLLFLYILSCKHRNMIGLYALPIPYGAFDLSWTVERFTKGLSELSDNAFINYNKNTTVVFIKNFLKYNPLENPNQVKGAMKVIQTIPTSTINTELIDYLNTVDKPFIKPLTKLLGEQLGKQVDVDVDVDVKEEEEVVVEKNKKNAMANTYKPIIDFLNNKCGTHYRHNTDKTKESINARINEGFTLQDFKIVIEKKADEWTGTKYEKYLRPQTLFGTKFESYLNQNIVKEKKDSDNGNVFLEMMEEEE